MKFLSITGPKFYIDRVADVYLSKYEMHLENALTELDSAEGLHSSNETNPYKDYLSKVNEILSILPSNIKPSDKHMSVLEAQDIISNSYKALVSFREKKDILKAKKKELTSLLQKMEPFRLLNFDIASISNYNFIKFRYGKISHDSFNEFLRNEYSDLDMIFFESDSDESSVWGMYFVPCNQADRLDAIMSSKNFERIHLDEDLKGKTEDIYQGYAEKLKDTSSSLKQLKTEINDYFKAFDSDLVLAKNILENMSLNCDIRKYAAFTRESGKLKNTEHTVFYIICGWMTAEDAENFKKEIEDDPDVFCVSDDDDISTAPISKPPTKLKNPRLFRPFEMFVKLYGIPAYNEIDPTIILTLTYCLLFGIMFGDVGQGAILVIGGFLFYKIKKQNLGAIIGFAGIFSIVFGFMYGSVFGLEHLLKEVWIKPMENINQILITTIGAGICLNLVSMIINIINGIKTKDIERIFFDTNGLAGFVFYGTLIGCVVCYLLGYKLPPTSVIVGVLCIPLIFIFFREPLGRKAAGKKTLIVGGKGMFFIESFFELFEILLSFLTNSLSFVRVGAFALSHAGMMSIVLMLTNVETSHPNIIGFIFGNLFVIGLEGLSVGIQVLRLEYFEMFSRYYGGNGKEFVPFKKAL